MDTNSNNETSKKKDLAWLKYKFDNAFAGGVKMQFIMLFISMALIILIVGPIVGLVGRDGTIFTGMAEVRDHLISYTLVLYDDVTDVLHYLILFAVAILGMGFFSTFIGIINNAISKRMSDLSKGHSKIIEEGHIVILGFNDNIHTILSEINKSNENWTGNKKVIIVDSTDKTAMEDTIKNKKNLIFRSGDLADSQTLEMVSVETARNIIINASTDFEVVRIMLALSNYLGDHDAYMNEKMPSIVALMHDEKCQNAAKIAAGVHHDYDNDEEGIFEKKVQLMGFDHVLAHLFAQSCRQPGLSYVISEMFDFDGCEVYIENRLKDGTPMDSVFAGKSLKEINQMLKNGIAIGFRKGQSIVINPDPNELKFEEGDHLLHFAEDDNELVIDSEMELKMIGTASEKKTESHDDFKFLILGWSDPVPEIIENIDQYASEESTVAIVAENVDESKIHINNVKLSTYCGNPYDIEHAIKALEDHPDITNIIIMCDPSKDKVTADQMSTILLLNIREYLKDKKLDKKVNVTTEMHLAQDQKLLNLNAHNDFIVGSEIACKMLIQVSANTELSTVFAELLSDDGSEFYLKPFTDYVDVTKPFNFNFIQKTAEERADKNNPEIILGWVKLAKSTDGLTTHVLPDNEKRNEIFRLQTDQDSFDDYRLIVIAKD